MVLNMAVLTANPAARTSATSPANAGFLWICRKTWPTSVPSVSMRDTLILLIRAIMNHLDSDTRENSTFTICLCGLG